MRTSKITDAGVAENDRIALRLTYPWHAEYLRHSRTGDILVSACDCMLDRDHSYAERMSWPQGLMQRAS